MQTDSHPPSPTTARDLADSLASLHQRMDRFYAWASQLQVEHRDLKQRVSFLESFVLQGGGVDFVSEV